MKPVLTICLTAIALALATSAVSAQTTALREQQGFSVEFAVGVVGIDEFDSTELAVAVNPRWCRDRNDRRIWCWWIDIWWINGPWPDPWRGLLRVDDLDIPVGDLDVGPALMIAPALEYQFRADDRLSPSLYFGVGAQRDEGATTVIPGVGAFKTESVTSPVAIFGGALTYDLTDRTALRIAAGGSMVFMDDMDITGPNGELFNAQGGDTLSGVISVGLDVSF